MPLAMVTTQTSQPPTATATLVATNTPTLTASPTKTATRTEIVMPTSTPLPTATPTPTTAPTITPPPTLTPECVPTDQDKYVWGPERLHVFSPCIRVTGIVKKVDTGNAVEHDGDAIVELALDPPFSPERYLWPENHGTLHVEVICYYRFQMGCVNDPDPLLELPFVGQHVWMEGRWVLDKNGKSELHPLYRWGPVK
jgi:hypothetical protein